MRILILCFCVFVLAGSDLVSQFRIQHLEARVTQLEAAAKVQVLLDRSRAQLRPEEP